MKKIALSGKLGHGKFANLNVIDENAGRKG
jgi:hypothetical protein